MTERFYAEIKIRKEVDKPATKDRYNTPIASEHEERELAHLAVNSNTMEGLHELVNNVVRLVQDTE